MLLFLGTGKSLQRILLAPVKIPTQEPAENQTDSESTSNSILCLHYYKSFVVRRCGEARVIPWSARKSQEKRGRQGQITVG